MKIHASPIGYVVKADDGATEMFKSLDEALDLLKHGSHDQSVHGRRGSNGSVSAAPATSAGNSSGSAGRVDVGGPNTPTHFADGTPLPLVLPSNPKSTMGNLRDAAKQKIRDFIMKSPNAEHRRLADPMGPRSQAEHLSNIVTLKDMVGPHTSVWRGATDGYWWRWRSDWRQDGRGKTKAQIQQEGASAPKYGLPAGFTGAKTGHDGAVLKSED